MAIYHLSAKIISRGKGKSSVAASAYRSANRLEEKATGLIHDFSRKKNVKFSEIILPKNAPNEFLNRQTLWNSVEENERQKNAQLAREIEFALPVELNFEQRKNLAHNFAKTFAESGMCVDLAIHDLPKNPHCHLLLTLRGLDEQGKWLPKCKKVNNRRIDLNDWNKKETLEKWRKLWEIMANDALKTIGSQEKIDCRSYTKRGINQIPTIHMGQAATALERQGILTGRGNLNRAISIYNHQISLTNETEKIESNKKILQNYQNALKEIPSPDDFFHFYLWTIAARKKVRKQIDRLIGKFIDTQAEIVEKIANESEEGIAVHKAKSNLSSLQTELQNQCKLCNELEKEVARIKREEPYEKISTLRFLFHMSESSRQEQEWKKMLAEKQEELQNANSVALTLQDKLEDAKTTFEVAQKKLEGKRNIIQEGGLLKTEPALATLNNSIELLKQDGDFLTRLKKNCDIKINESPRLKKAISKYLYLADSKEFSKIDISHVRNIRIAEQEIKSPNFLSNLAQILDNDNAVQLVAISDPEFLEMPINWDLISELEKDEILHKKMLREL